MANDIDWEKRLETITKQVEILRGVVDTPLSETKVALERCYLSLYHKGARAFLRSYKQATKGIK